MTGRNAVISAIRALDSLFEMMKGESQKEVTNERHVVVVTGAGGSGCGRTPFM